MDKSKKIKYYQSVIIYSNVTNLKRRKERDGGRKEEREKEGERMRKKEICIRWQMHSPKWKFKHIYNAEN